MVSGWERTGITPANRGDLGGVAGMSGERKKDKECDSLGSNAMAKAEGGEMVEVVNRLYGDDGGVRVLGDGLDGDLRKDEEDAASFTVVVVTWWWCNGSPMVESHKEAYNSVIKIKESQMG
ncbi:hypothetical protein L1987_69667 [Smallanthus sonchifolius]|uniref:Uncharacterized protein n=1 Tax=Smallanthus sonchifolius TaxID=185202 RepID=A0ACB9B6I2_9ASTR|nr:hypothetical protein L1987_69667 [Smallanthus sonchifolius]